MRRVRGDRGDRIEAVVDGIHVKIVDVEQDAAAAAPRNRRDKFKFGYRRIAILQITGNVFDEDAATQSRLHLIDARHHQRESFFGIGQRQEIIEVPPAVRAPA